MKCMGFCIRHSAFCISAAQYTDRASFSHLDRFLPVGVQSRFMQPNPGSHASPDAASHPSRAELDALRTEFFRRFGEGQRRTRIVRAPGRVNLIGEHTDYNDGFVFPMAIEPEARIVCRSRDDGVVRIGSTAFPDEVAEFSVQHRILPGKPEWANYLRGVAAQLISVGIPLTGMDALVANTLAVGSGLSSSAAIEVAAGHAFLTLAGLEMDAQRLALLCQKAEHTFAGVPCGIMDQTIVAGARPGHAMLLDCRDLSRQYVTVDSRELRVVIINSMVKHALTGGEYAERRKQCEEGVAFFRAVRPQIRALRDVSREEVDAAEEKLPKPVFRRCRHVVGEIARTVKAAGALSGRDYDEFGRLMQESHASLRDDYEVSTEELDYLVELAMQVRGVYGARMTGAGFGGCVVTLAQPRAVDSLVERVTGAYREKTGKTPQFYVTTAAPGAGVLQ
jgi:galactokinase